jgi:hypothetical protein
MITVQRRWFIPPHLYDEFRLRWLEEMGPVLPSHPGRDLRFCHPRAVDHTRHLGHRETPGECDSD